MSPEEIGLCGCWQGVAVARQSQDLTAPDEPASLEIGCYATSLTVDQRDDPGMLAAIENGTHYRRDVTLGEDACRTAGRQGAAGLASFRNLAIGLYELQRTQADSLRAWCQQQTSTTIWPLLQR